MPEQQPPALFDLTLTEEQQMMRDTVARFAESEMRERSRTSDEAGHPPEGFYQRALELGFNMVQLPEALGGMGAPRSPVGNMLIAEDLASGDMSLAIGALSSLSFINAVLDQGTQAQQRTWLPRFAEETLHQATVALLESQAGFDPASMRTTAKRVDQGYELTGTKSMVPLASASEVMLVVAKLEGEGPAAFFVQAGADGMHIERQPYMGLRALSLDTVKLEGVTVPADARLGESFDLQRLIDLGKIGLSALTVGTCQAILDYVKEYCNERVAFGEPITNRQSVAFMIADIAIELEGLRMLTYRAAARAEQGLDFHKQAYQAHLQAADKGMKIGTDGVQLLGGHGFIRDHMVELWYRNLRAIGILSGCAIV
ncbi:MAG: acyl-CoA dehydrogenase family protein [Myxococcales bacterium]|nr:acyl-CoA dehydrogenase family protein [Myxococcales bacterium]